MVRRRLPTPRRPAQAPRNRARPVRVRRGATPRAGASRRVPGAGREGAGLALARDVRGRGEARQSARRDPRLRGDQAPERRALPRRGPRARVLSADGDAMKNLDKQLRTLQKQLAELRARTGRARRQARRRLKRLERRTRVKRSEERRGGKEGRSQW